ncbi:MAG: CBS domain-containing protein [Solirubrobacteraceae bacterium]
MEIDDAQRHAAAEAVLEHGLWCLLEACVDVAAQRWDPCIVICEEDPDAVVAAIRAWIAGGEAHDLRLRGCDRATLVPSAQLAPVVCRLVGSLRAPTFAPGKPAIGVGRQRLAATRRRTKEMQVRDGMNAVVVTVGAGHTLREAAKRMTARSVGAAVVMDDDLQAPAVITERDILQSNGVGQDIDTELVQDHLTSRPVYAVADWSLERAAAEMVRGGFRHVIVLDGSEVIGILSMRDIVRCWTSPGAACEVGSDSA